MKNITIIAVNFIKLTFTNKMMYIVFFVIPVAAFITAFLLFGSPSTQGFSIGYVNNDEGNIGSGLISFLNGASQNRVFQSNETNFQQELTDGIMDLGLIIPEDYSEDLRTSRAPNIRIVSIQGETVTSFAESQINQYTHSVLQLSETAETEEEFNDLYARFSETDTSLSVTRMQDDNRIRAGSASSIGFLIFMILLQASLIANQMLKEKEECTYTRIRTAPIREVHYTLGNTLAAFCIIAVQLLLTFSIGLLIPGLSLGFSLLAFIPVLGAFTAAAVSLAILFTAVSKTQSEAAFLGNIVILPTCMLAGCFWPIDFMPAFVQRLTVIFPQRWIMDALYTLQSGGGFSAVIPQILLLTGFTGLFVTTYALQMKKQD
ncbi:MAG: ABC transporter permease [Spirochaetia bacterium]